MTEKEYWSTGPGRVILTVVCCIVVWGLTLALWMSESEAAVIVMLLCAFFGWRALCAFTPVVFIWAPIGGWLIYLIVKFIFSALIGLFVAPFQIGSALANWIREAI